MQRLLKSLTIKTTLLILKTQIFPLIQLLKKVLCLKAILQKYKINKQTLNSVEKKDKS